MLVPSCRIGGDNAQRKKLKNPLCIGDSKVQAADTIDETINYKKVHAG